MNENPEELELRQLRGCGPSPGLEERCRQAWVENESIRTTESAESWRFMDLAPAVAGLAVWMLALLLLISPPAPGPEEPIVVKEEEPMPEEQIMWRSPVGLLADAERKQSAMEQRREIMRRLQEI
jgi:hypothetical protein